jgi:hypothetical protein
VPPGKLGRRAERNLAAGQIRCELRRFPAVAANQPLCNEISVSGSAQPRGVLKSSPPTLATDRLNAFGQQEHLRYILPLRIVQFGTSTTSRKWV